MSPYDGLNVSEWKEKTEELVKTHPLDAYSGLFGQYFREYPDNKTGYIRTPCHVL